MIHADAITDESVCQTVFLPEGEVTGEPAGGRRVAMPDETKPKDLETVLARLKNEWRELADLLTTQGKSQDRVIEVEQIRFRDASGRFAAK